jgi:NAD(P)-dependent dehydrogenase (short-subunit alcohol dehydrogenase family)
MEALEPQLAMVCCGKSGSGAAIADALAEAGWRVSAQSGESVPEGASDIGCLVVVAGQAPAGGVLTSGPDDVHQALAHNVTDSLALIRAAAPRMPRSTGRASIVLVLEGLYDGDGEELSLAGAMSAGALERAIQVLACELGPLGVRVNGVRALTRLPHIPLPSVPLGGTATAGDIAAVVRFLAGDEASYVTGVVVPLDGGVGAIR